MQFDILRKTRTNHMNIIDRYDEQKLNFIPAGFNNNLIWNLGHVIVTQQLLCYKMSGERLRIDSTLVEKYRKGSRPEEVVDTASIQVLKDYMFSTIDQMELDLSNGLFQTYKTYPTSYGFTLDSIEAAITFNNVHEAMHLGTMIAIQKFL